MSGSLKDVLVVDLTNYLSGPYCTMLLADMGADVIKVERPDVGDDGRHVPPLANGLSTTFAILHRNKRSIALDFKDRGDLAVLTELLLRADVVVQNMRPGAFERLGVDWARIDRENPGLVKGSVSGFGQAGPWAHHGGFDLMAQGMSGLMAGNGPADGGPFRLPIAISDITAGLIATIGILSALVSRGKTGKGQHIDTSLFEAALAFGTNEAAAFFLTGETPKKMGHAHRGAAPYQAFEAQDGWLTIGASQDHFFRKLCEVLEVPHLAVDPRFATTTARYANHAELADLLTQRTKSLPRDHWLGRLGEAKIPAEAILSYDQAITHPQAKALGVIATVPGAAPEFARTLATPFRMSGTPPTIRSRAPELNEHADEIRNWLAASCPRLPEQA